ncbi:ABC transporter permease [Actinobaculum massiliense]|uniref:ABC transporter permease n=1 Tax=Actinobaculum massiliense TaxID=202789 RepID=UPI00288C3D62|nr:iron chelate uptake ABC transporter family permease subunit [Actinobaculum massiliense]
MSTPETITSPGKTGAKSRSARKPIGWGFLLAVILLIGLLVVSLFTGAYDLSQPNGREMFWITRVPRTAALILAGIAMSLCGLVMQLLAQNKFVEPTTTGTTEWAGLGLLIAMIIVPEGSGTLRMVSAIFVAFIGTLCFFMFLRRVTLQSSVIVPIVGLMLGAVVSSISTFLALRFNVLQNLSTWFQGSFAPMVRGRYEPLWITLAVTLFIFLLADRLTVIGLGKDVATNVGINYNAMLLIGTGAVAAGAGVVTVVVGNLPFLGLIVPNIISLTRGDDLRSNLPWVCVLGAGVTTACDLLSRTLIAPFEIPVSLILGVLGCAVFVALIVSRRKVLQ